MNLRHTLASLSIVLMACQDPGVKPTVTFKVADTADQVLVGMSHYITQNGVRRSLVEADTARLYDISQLAGLKNMTVTFYDANGGETSVVTADSGTYHMKDGSMLARGNVVARTPDGRRLMSPVLVYDEKSNSISSDQPFVYDNADEHLEGNGFKSDPDFRNVVTQQPRGGQRPGQVGKTKRDTTVHVLPGQ